MSLSRAQRAVRAIGGFSGGTSRLARPPAVLEEPDVRPGCVTTAHGIGGQDMFESRVTLDPATLTGDCGVGIWELDANFLFLSEGEYDEAVGVLDVDGDHGGIDWEFFFGLYDPDDFTLIWEDSVVGQPDDLMLTHGAFTVPAGGAVLGLLGIPEPLSPVGQELGAGSYVSVTQ